MLQNWKGQFLHILAAFLLILVGTGGFLSDLPKSWVGPLEGPPTLQASKRVVKQVWSFAGHLPDPTPP